MKAAMEFRLTKRVEGNRYSKKKKKSKKKRDATNRTADFQPNYSPSLDTDRMEKKRRKSSRTVSKERAEKG